MRTGLIVFLLIQIAFYAAAIAVVVYICTGLAGLGR